MKQRLKSGRFCTCDAKLQFNLLYMRHAGVDREQCKGRSSTLTTLVSLGPGSVESMNTGGRIFFLSVITVALSAPIVRGLTLGDLMDKPWSQVSSHLPPGRFSSYVQDTDGDAYCGNGSPFSFLGLLA